MELLGNPLGATRTLLRNAHGTRGVSLFFNTQHLPCFTVWKNTTAVADGCVTGLEPGTNFPNPRSFEGEKDRVVKLAPKGSFGFDYQLEYHSNAEEVEVAEKAIAKLQGKTEPTIHKTPQPDWCA